MKKILLIFAAALIAISASAEVWTVYVNPLQNQTNANATITKRLYKKALLGLTKAKTIAVSSGDAVIKPGSPEAAQYNYIMTINLAKASIEEAATLGNILGALGSSKKTDPDWTGKLETEIILTDAQTGAEAFKTTLIPQANNKEKSLALFNATKHVDSYFTDMTDDAFQIGGTVPEAVDFDKKNVAKRIRAQVGSKDGARQNQSFEIYKVVGDQREAIGEAVCEQVLNAGESLLELKGKKDAVKKVSDLVVNNDGSYSVEVLSRSKRGFLHNNFETLDKMFSSQGRTHYLDPFNRTAKPRIGFLALEINDQNFAGQREGFEQAVVKGMSNVPTITLDGSHFYNSVQEAQNAGLDGLIEISIDKVFPSTETTKEGKTNYKTEVLYTISGFDVKNNRWIDMKTTNNYGQSLEGQAKANADALVLMDECVQKFAEDLFPVAANVVGPEEVKKNAVKKVRIDNGTDMGLKKGMTFDIFEQRAEGGADTRLFLGEGKVEKDGLAPTEAILSVKGKNNGDERLLELIQNQDNGTKIVLVSKASYNILDKGLNFLKRDN